MTRPRGGVRWYALWGLRGSTLRGWTCYAIERSGRRSSCTEGHHARRRVGKSLPPGCVIGDGVDRPISEPSSSLWENLSLNIANNIVFCHTQLLPLPAIIYTMCNEYQKQNIVKTISSAIISTYSRITVTVIMYNWCYTLYLHFHHIKNLSEYWYWEVIHSYLHTCNYFL